MNACIVLAAGLSSRFESPKALVDFKGRPVIHLILETILRTKIDETYVVLGAHQQLIEPQILKHKNIHIVYNKDYILGQTSSFKTGVKAIHSKNTNFFLWPVDYPFITHQTINTMIDYSLNNKQKILIPVHNNKKGHPPLFHSTLKEEILKLDDALGVNTLIHQYSSEERLFTISDSGVLLSFNTPQEWEHIKNILK